MDAMSVVKQIGQNTKIRSKLNVDKNITNSSFDKTYIGRVIGKNNYSLNQGGNLGTAKENENIVSEWLVYAGGQNFKIDVNNCDITYVGEEVRVFVPSNNKLNVYAEAISPANAPDKTVYKVKDEKYASYKSYGVDETRGVEIDDITINTLTQYWILNDGTYLQKVYILTIINAGKEDEEVTNVIHPDGRKEVLEGFFIGKTTSRSASNSGNSSSYNDLHPVKLEYKDEDSEYELPDSIKPYENETFDTVTEYWDNIADYMFSSSKVYKSGNLCYYNGNWYECKINAEDITDKIDTPTLMENQMFYEWDDRLYIITKVKEDSYINNFEIYYNGDFSDIVFDEINFNYDGNEIRSQTWYCPENEKESYMFKTWCLDKGILYVCIKQFHTNNSVNFEEYKSNFKALTGEDNYVKVVWGVGVKNKDTNDEEVTRLIYPDFSQVELINFNGISGLG